MLIFFGTSGHVHTSQDQLCLTLDPPKLLQKIQENHLPFVQNIFGNLRISKIETFGKDAYQQILEIGLLFVENLEYEINILKQHEFGIWYFQLN